MTEAYDAPIQLPDIKISVGQTFGIDSELRLV